MNSAFRMLLAAMMRARCVGWLRSWISAYIGTLYRPANRPAAARSAITRQCAAAADVNWPSVMRGRGRQAARGEVQVDREHAHADRAQRHQADLHVPARQHLAQQRADADADREHHQQQRGHLLVAVQHLLGEAGELAQEHRAEEPHPADAQQRAEHHQVAVRELQVAPGFAERVPVDLAGPDRSPARRGWTAPRRGPASASAMQAIRHVVRADFAAWRRAGRPPRCPAGWRRRCPSPPCRCRRSARARSGAAAGRRT